MRTFLAAAIVAAIASSASAQEPTRQELEDRIRLLELENRALKLRNQEFRKEARELGPYLDEARYSKVVAEVQAQTEKIVGQEMGSRIRPIIMDRKELGPLLEEKLGAEFDKPEFHAMRVLLEAFDAIRPGADLRAMYSDLLEASIGGFYDDDNRNLVVIRMGDPSAFLGQFILSHEITHALQDKHYDLSSLGLRDGTSDSMSAVLALVEGDATWTMMQWAGERFTPAVLLQMIATMGEQQGALNDAPPFLVANLVYPYLEGMKFFVRAQSSLGRNWRESVFASPPKSTEQVLHFEKYESGELPQDAALLPWPEGSDLKELHRDTLGEFYIRMLLTPPEKFPRGFSVSLNPIPAEAEAIAAAAGWGGDQISVARSEDGRRIGILWRTTWDTPNDAQEFGHAIMTRIAATRMFTAEEEGAPRMLQQQDGTFRISGRDGALARIRFVAPAEVQVTIFSTAEDERAASAAFPE